MSLWMSVWILMSSASAHATPSLRCVLLQSENARLWLSEERTRPWQRLPDAVQNVRDAAWLPTVRFSTDFSIDDDERLSWADNGQTSDYRTSAITRGGQEFGLELALKWELGQLKASALELGVRRHQRQLLSDHQQRLLELTKAWGAWMSSLVKLCKSSPPERPILYAEVVGLEARLDHFSAGRFSTWLKEQVQ